MTAIHMKDGYVERFQRSKSRAMEMIRKLSRELQKDVERVKTEAFDSDVKSVSVENSGAKIEAAPAEERSESEGVLHCL